MQDDANATVDDSKEIVGTIQESTEAVANGRNVTSIFPPNRTADVERRGCRVEHGATADGVVALQAIGAMNAIIESSNEIPKIIGVIDEFACQTNLLVLNASVEAVWADDQGRGFFVVATKVRNLARRSGTGGSKLGSCSETAG